jgi:copper chaperone CopZ
MADGAGNDQLAVLRVEGMHCHNCEAAIKRTLSSVGGVHEVEVDFNSSQASVLYDPKMVSVQQLVAETSRAGYRVTGFTQPQAQPGGAAH